MRNGRTPLLTHTHTHAKQHTHNTGAECQSPPTPKRWNSSMVHSPRANLSKLHFCGALSENFPKGSLSCKTRSPSPTHAQHNQKKDSGKKV